VSVSAAATLRSPPRPIASVMRRLGLDAVEFGALIALTGLSFAVLAGLLVKGRPLSGADGLLASDQLQYFAWIREASQHLLIGDRFDLAPGGRPFLHPGFLISGLIHRLTGISIPLSYLLWKPVAIGVTFSGCLLYVRRLLPAGPRRHTALVLALFAVMPASAIVAWTGWGGKPRQFTFDFIAGEMWSGQYLWGYLMTAIGVFLMPLVLLAVESWRRHRRPAMLAWASAGALLICWLQPWQGATVALIVVAVEAWRYLRSREWPPLALLAIPVAAGIPALYYFLLSRYDTAWSVAAKANAAGAQLEWSWPWWAIVLTVAPLANPAALAYRLPATDWQQQALRIWPFAALAVYLQPTGTFPYHSFQGLTLPLAILAVQGVASVWRRPSAGLIVAALAVMTLPGIAHRVEVAANSVHTAGDPFWVFPGEVQAQKWLARDPQPGGVLAAPYAGFMVPYRTGRETYVGPISWSPDWQTRARMSNDLIEGRLRGAAALAFIVSTHARYVFQDCRPLPRIDATIAPLAASVHRFGCATVWVLHSRPDMARAAGLPDA
jgi:hypothetical protein